MTRSLPTTQLQQNNTRGRGAGPAAHRQAQGHSPSPARPAHLAQVPPTRSGIRVNVFQPALSAPLVRLYAYLVSTRCSECTAQDHPPAPTLGVSSPRRYLDLKGTLGVTGTLPPELFGSKMSELIAVRAKYSSLSGTLPASIFELPRLDRIYIGGSRRTPLLISGTLPSEMGEIQPRSSRDPAEI